MCDDDPVIERRGPEPEELNPWDGVAAIGLHNHTAAQACDEWCSVYERD